MKALFAVNNEEISESIVKKYQKEYKQIISYKNVYYFNAILKELQKDKTYDRIVISEDLESFTNNQYDQIDKFIFEKLDSISDEASNINGNDIPIILICSDRRTKSEAMLVKLFGIGIYNAIIGNDRSVDEVCKLINRPRAKKEAKTYYQIDTEEVQYHAENENDVSEMEIQNIVAHYKRLGKNEDRYIDSFNNIAAQYNDTQLRIISKFLPLNVRAVLEEKSPKYQQIMSFNNSVSNSLRKIANDEDEGPSQVFLKSKNRESIISKPVVIPSAVNMTGTKKLTRQKQAYTEPQGQYNKEQKQEVIQQPIVQHPTEQPIVQQPAEPIIEGFENLKTGDNEQVETQKELNLEIEPEVVQPVKRGRGRPRKNPTLVQEDVIQKPKRGRGRPRKNVNPIQEKIQQEEIQEEEFVLPGLDAQPQKQGPEDQFLPGFTNVNTSSLQQKPLETTQGPDDETFLPGFMEKEEPISQIQPIQEQQPFQPVQPIQQMQNPQTIRQEPDISFMTNNMENNRQADLSSLLTPDKKIATFVGTSKNGTSFIVNNLAQLMSSVGVNTAILDTTQNRNSYYIYTKNEESLREVATHSIEKLARGVANGISVNKNLTVYTSLPDENDSIQNVDKILETLLMNHSLILIDTDFETPLEYFAQSQETYLVQTMDILTIQPLTAFLKQLKMKNILDETKLRIVLNKVVKIRGIKDEVIIGGMAFYNDPAMSFMTELFDKDRIKYVSMPFEEETYIRYLEGIIECEISLKGYSRMFLQTLKELGNMIYPIITSVPRNNKNYQPPSVQVNSRENFSPNMNNTLDRMKRGY